MGLLPDYLPYGDPNSKYAKEMGKINWRYKDINGGILEDVVIGVALDMSFGPLVGPIVDVIRSGVDIIDKMNSQNRDYDIKKT